MKLEDILTPQELESIFLEERSNPSIIQEMRELLPDKYISLIDKYIQDEDQATGMYRAFTYLVSHLSKKVMQ